jgi:transcription initiation factor TFIID subunit TAF12
MNISDLKNSLKELNNIEQSGKLSQDKLFNSNFILEHTTLKTYDEFISKFNIKEGQSLDEVPLELKNKIINEITSFKKWDDFFQFASNKYFENLF